MVRQANLNREVETTDPKAARIQMLAELRAAYLAGRLDDLLFTPSNHGMDRLIDDLFGADLPGH